MPKVCCCYSAAVALFSVFLLPVAMASADQPENSQSNDENSSAVLNLPIDSKAMKALDRAVDLINEEAWDDALKLLQSVLDAPENSFLPLDHKGGNIRSDVYISARAEANRLIESLPAKAKEIYEQRYGAEAARRLDEAKKQKSEQAVLAAIADRYRHTAAGREVLKVLPDRQSASGSMPHEASGWPMFGGDPARSAQTEGGVPFLETKWTQAMHVSGELSAPEQWIKEAVKASEDHHIPILPAFFPIAATIHMDGKLVPLVIYRSHYGIHAIKVQNGKLYWEQSSRLSIDNVALDPARRGTMEPWVQAYAGGSFNPLIENSTLGCLTTDNVNVYAVEDLAVPPHPSFLKLKELNGGQLNFGALDGFVRHNCLQAYALDSGKIQWELGGRGSDHGELADSYFLGPPLPLRGKLYVLNEKDGEIRLVCLDPVKNWNEGQNPIVWKLRLGGVRDKILVDSRRRIQAANISYADGILICPTNAGSILGIDLLTRSLIWAYSYRKNPAPEANDQRMQRILNLKGIAAAKKQPPQVSSEYAVSAPAIQEGKAVFTAPDCPELICIRLRDGRSIWKAARTHDLFLAGVYNRKVLLVGKDSCRALSLADGKELWRVKTGLPSGRGMAAGDVYYLPLKSAVDSSQPAIYAIDINQGLIVARSPFRQTPDGQTEVPGNLLFFAGDMISQNLAAITAYPQLSTKSKQTNEELKTNRLDPVGLVHRAELRLAERNWQGAVEDLRPALAQHPPADILPKARALLFEALAKLLQQDFNAGERFLDEFKELSQVPIPEGASVEERRQAEDEQELRRWIYLTSVGMGRERQGRLREALQAYSQLALLASPRPRQTERLVSVPGEVALRARADVWSRGRIASLLARDVDRSKLQEEIARQWKSVHNSRDIDKLGNFVSLFGIATPEGKEACLELAEQLIAGGRFLEPELLLLQLKRQGDSVYAGRAVLALARFMVQKEQLEDAAFYYRTLNRDFGKTLVRDGRTGADFFNEMASDKRLLPYLDAQRVPGSGARIRAREVRGNFPSPMVFFESWGEPSPFAERYRFVLSLNPLRIQLHDTTNDAECWSQNLANEPGIQKLISGGRSIAFPSHHLGHLMVLSLGSRVYGLEPAEHRVVWDGLVDPDTAEVVQPVHAPERQILFPKERAESSVKLGPVEASCVCIQIGTDVVALEPLRGRVLWTRANVPAGADAFGDDQYVFLADVHDGAAVQRKGLALRAQDGSLVSVPDWVALYRRRLGVVGRHLLLSESNPKTDTTLRLYDVVSGQNLWKKVFTANALIVHCQDPNLAGVVEPSDGRLTVFSSRTGNDLFLAQINVRDLDQVHDLQLFSDTGMHYLALNRPTTLQKELVGPVWPGVGANIRTAAVNGKIYAFDRTSSKVRWYANVANQVLVLDQFNKMGLLLFAARFNRPMNQMDNLVVTVKSIDKRSGKLLFEKEYPFQGNLFNVITDNSRRGSVELVRQDLKIVHSSDN